MSNEREERVKLRYEVNGWRMLRGGAPDFLAVRVVNGEIVEARAIEVKSPGTDLTYEQAVFRQILERCGIEYVVEVEE